jgi:hypothetical protein
VPQAKTAKPKIEVVLEKSIPKKHSVRFETEAPDIDLSNIYLRMTGYRKLGSPSMIKITVEAADPPA